MITLLLLLASAAHADWGLPNDLIVGKCACPTETFRGRAQQTNGSAALTIWKVGTKRIVAVHQITREANDLIKDKLDFHRQLFAEFTACPLGKDEPGHRAEVCVEKIEKLRWKKID